MKLQDFDFRVWDKHHKGCGNKDCKCQTKYVYGEEAKTRLSEFKEDCEIELFTGLYDKNGNKIYEG
ncbi:YopX family protein, partial [Campylobacter coli]